MQRLVQDELAERRAALREMYQHIDNSPKQLIKYFDVKETPYADRDPA